LWWFFSTEKILMCEAGVTNAEPDLQFGTHCLMICVMNCELCTISAEPEDVPVRLTFEALAH